MALLSRAVRPLLAAVAASACLAVTLSAALASDEDWRRSLQAACQQRMGELRAQERANAEQIDWQVSATRVTGQYTGFAPDFACRLRDEGGEGPRSAQLSYQEVVYEKSGATAREARKATPRPVEIHDVTLVLIYRDGRWE